MMMKSAFGAARLTAIALLIASLTSTAAMARLRHPSRPAPVVFTLHWGHAPRSGPYPLAPGLVNLEVDAPNGHTPSYSDLESLQYHHHTRVAVSRKGRIWVAYSGTMRHEGSSGMITEVKSSTNGSTWSAPIVVIAPPSPFDGKQVAGRRISYPRAFVTYRRQLYIVAAIDQPNGYGCCTNEQGEALVAAALHPNGTIGRPFRVSRAAYAPLKGSPGYPYNPRLGPQIFALANNFGTWGGSAPGQPASAWTGYGTAADGTTLVEPNTIQLSRHPDVLFRLWRDEGTTGQFVLYTSISKDFGATWSPPVPTDIPNSPSEATITKLANGDIAVIGNALDEPTATDSRDPLYLAVFNGRTGALRKVFAVRQGVGAPRYNNGVVCGPHGKPCGAAYPGAYEYHGMLYISYSIDKQQIWLAAVPEAGL